MRPLHRVRQGFVRARTAQANQFHGLLREFGILLPQGIAYITQRVPEFIEDASNALPGSFRLLINRLLEHLHLLHCQVDEIEAVIKPWHRDNKASRRLEKVPGIGPLTATALVAAMRADIVESFPDRIENVMSLGDDRSLPEQYHSALLIEVDRYLNALR